MKSIPLTDGKFALVDNEDYDLVSQFEWQYDAAGGGRAHRYTARRKQRLHHFILGVANNFRIDHKDRNGLNNVRSNLRPATRQENARNRGKQENNTSGFKGVTWDKARRKWKAMIGVNGRNINIGRFTELRDAATAYAKASLKFHKEFACVA